MGQAPRGLQSACPSLSASPPRFSALILCGLGLERLALALDLSGVLSQPFQGLPGLPALLCLAGAPL